MSDKFVVSTNEIGEIIVTDVETGNVYHYGSMSNFLGLIRLLNEQQSTIQSLKEGLKLEQDFASRWQKESEMLAKENEQLITERNLLMQKKDRYYRLYELKDSEVAARVNTLNKVCNYYLTEAQFKADTDPNEAVKEVLKEILNTEVEM